MDRKQKAKKPNVPRVLKKGEEKKTVCGERTDLMVVVWGTRGLPVAASQEHKMGGGKRKKGGKTGSDDGPSVGHPKRFSQSCRFFPRKEQAGD